MNTQHVFAAHARDALREHKREHERDATSTQYKLLIAGGAGALGSAVLERACGSGQWHSVTVYTQGLLQSSLGGLHMLAVDDERTAFNAEAGMIVLDHARLFHERERMLWMPGPHELLSTARRMQEHGVKSLAIVVPYLQASLPQALKAGLNSLDEQVVHALNFERLLIIRPSSAAQKVSAVSALDSIANWMLSQLRYMIPERERPVRAIKLASFVDAALHAWMRSGNAGTKVVAAEVLWQAAVASDMQGFVQRWLNDELAEIDEHTEIKA